MINFHSVTGMQGFFTPKPAIKNPAEKSGVLLFKKLRIY